MDDRSDTRCRISTLTVLVRRENRNWRFCPPDPLSAQPAQLVLRFAREQIDEAALDALALEERELDLAGDRHLDPELVREGQRRTDRVRALGRPRQRGLDLGP
jgi:hypothetical protein